MGWMRRTHPVKSDLDTLPLPAARNGDLLTIRRGKRMPRHLRPRSSLSFLLPQGLYVVVINAAGSSTEQREAIGGGPWSVGAFQAGPHSTGFHLRWGRAGEADSGSHVYHWEVGYGAARQIRAGVDPRLSLLEDVLMAVVVTDRDGRVLTIRVCTLDKAMVAWWRADIERQLANAASFSEATYREETFAAFNRMGRIVPRSACGAWLDVVVGDEAGPAEADGTAPNAERNHFGATKG